MYTTAENVLGFVLAGAGTGVLGAMLGVGGGVFLIPVLVIGFGVHMHHAVATSIFSVIATSSAVASTNVERGTANMRLGMTLEIATALGGIVGGFLAGWLKPEILEGLFAVVVVPVALLMWRGRRGEEGPEIPLKPKPALVPVSALGSDAETVDPELGELGARYYDDFERREISYRVKRIWAGMGISFVAGNLSGLLGIGGGVFKVPALNLLCGVPIKAAAATSNFMIGVTAAASATLYFRRGEVRPALTAAVVLGVLAGSALGSLVNRRVHGATIRRLFAVLLLAVAVNMFYRAIAEVR
jgi:uncharacterized membrane protein YfcA